MKHKLIFIPVMVLGSVVVTALTAIAGINLFKFAIYRDYYDAETEVARVPDLNNGFVPQGCSVFVDGDDYKYFAAGYMADDSASRMYVTDSKGNYHYVTFKEDGKTWYGHTGGMSVNGDRILLVNEAVDTSTVPITISDGAVYSIPLEDVLNANNGDILSLDTKYNLLDNHSSYISSYGEYVYIGEFHGAKYVCEHEYETSEGTHYAIVGKYHISDLSTPVEYISVRDLVQGFAINPDNGDFVLSTSYGLHSSHYYLYKSDALVDSEKTLNGVPVKLLVDAYKVVAGPQMSEDLEFYTRIEGENKYTEVLTLNESASNKYIFGKLFNAYHFHSLNFWKE